MSYAHVLARSNSEQLPTLSRMRPTLRSLVGALKDKTSLRKAALSCSSAAATDDPATTPIISPTVAVLRATTHHPLAEPPHPSHVETLLSFGAAPGPIASAAVRAIAARLRATRDASVALKCLLVVHCLATRGTVFLRDQLHTALHPPPGSGKSNPLNLSAFRGGSSPESRTLSTWARWYARVLELLLFAARVLGTAPNPIKGSDERATSLSSPELLSELETLLGLVEQISRAPDAANAEGNALVHEVVRMAGEEGATAELGILVRVREMRKRLGALRYADSVELLCLLRRLEEFKVEAPDVKRGAKDWFWSEVMEAKERAEEAVVRLEEEERGRGRRLRRERVGESARVPDRGLLGAAEPVRFGSSRFVDGSQRLENK